MRREWVVCIALVGCVTHKTLPVPPTALTAEQRLSWFNALAGETERTTFIENCEGDDCVVSHMATLANGTKIYAAEDLLPVIRADSATAEHARAARDARAHGDNWLWVAIGAAAGALAVAAATGHSDPSADNAAAAIWVIGGAGALVGGFVSREHYHHALAESDVAFRTYTKDLADRLEICVLDMHLVPCEYRAPAPSGAPGANEPPPEPPAPQQHVPDGPVATQ
ncbi:MAG: hypothetical protein ABI678_28590 [Kofleriaceae bacterium]